MIDNIIKIIYKIIGGKMANIKAIFFDFDGVMTIDKTGTISICNYISNNYPIDKKISEKEYRKYNNDLLYGKITHEDIWDKLCLNLNKNISILYDSFVNTPIDYQMYDFVNIIKKNSYITGLITDNKKDRMNIIIRENDLDKIFDVIIISSEIGSGKENKEIFKITLKNECQFK
jgi:putative hydrolase of the HAD superfamily